MNFRLRFDENKLLSRIQQQSNNHSASRGFDLYKLDICLPCKCWVNCSVRLLSWNLRGLRGRVFHFVYLLFCYYIFYSFLLQFKTKKNLSLSSQNLLGVIQIFVVPSLHGIIQMLAMSALNRGPMQVLHLYKASPLTPKSDQLLISPYNITPESNIRVTRIKEIITN